MLTIYVWNKMACLGEMFIVVMTFNDIENYMRLYKNLMSIDITQRWAKYSKYSYSYSGGQYSYSYSPTSDITS
jgi:hypothetical protein